MEVLNARGCDVALRQLSRYARVARNSQMLLVMEPPCPGEKPDIQEARDAIAEDAFSFLSEILEGVESPYFVTYTNQDGRFVSLLAAKKVRESTWDRVGGFEMEPRLHMTDASEAQAATFAYLAASWMRQVKVPFYQAPALRVRVTGPRNLPEFVRTVHIVTAVTNQARDNHFYEVVERNEWRIAYGFWEANKWFSQTLKVGQRSPDQLEG